MVSSFLHSYHCGALSEGWSTYGSHTIDFLLDVQQNICFHLKILQCY